MKNLNDLVEHTYIKTQRITLHVVQAGPPNGPLVILLHGFPEFWYGWKHQIPFLARQGYRVWAPDQRGYNLSARPKEIAAYRRDVLVADILGLMDAAGREKVSLIGHDWGAAVAWRLAMKYPERLQKLVILNVPHPSVMLAHLRHNWAQKRRSWYMLFFQLPWIPELVARAGNWHLLARTMTATYQPGTFNETDLKRYRQAWSQPGAFTAMLNWYRAGLRRRAKPTSQPRISVPTLMIWGVHDVALGREMAQPSIDYCDNGRLVFIEEATHWVQHDAPERVNKLLQEFLAD